MCDIHNCNRRPADGCDFHKCALRPGLEKACQEGAGECAKGLFCLSTPAKPTPQGSPRVRFGGRCWMGLKRNCIEGLECIRTIRNFGECKFSAKNRQPDRKLGEPCRSGSYHCVVDYATTGGIVCNQAYWDARPGVCSLTLALLHRPGQACNPELDLCDRRRNLRCARHDGRFVCLQRSALNGPCTPGSLFSTCSVKAEGTELQCRRRHNARKDGGFAMNFQCRRLAEAIPLGAVCSHEEHALCPVGSICAKVPGVITASRFNNTETRFCLRPVQEGGVCGNRFSDTCVGGAHCISGKSWKADKAPPTPKPTLAGFGGFCGGCYGKSAPGMTCRERICELIKVPGKPWDRCTPTATKKIACVKGSCMRALEWIGIKWCRPAGGVGAYCDRPSGGGDQNIGCRGSLECADFTSDPFLSYRKCSNVSRWTPPGARCDPKNSIWSLGGGQAKCLRRGSHFACQFDAYRLDLCPPNSNNRCVDRIERGVPVRKKDRQ